MFVHKLLSVSQDMKRLVDVQTMIFSLNQARLSKAGPDRENSIQDGIVSESGRNHF
jgi:hypothetical protein